MAALFLLSPYGSQCGTAIFDPATGEFNQEKYNQLWNGYQWDSPDTFSRVAAAAAGQAAKKEQ